MGHNPLFFLQKKKEKRHAISFAIKNPIQAPSKLILCDKGTDSFESLVSLLFTMTRQMPTNVYMILPAVWEVPLNYATEQGWLKHAHLLGLDILLLHHHLSQIPSALHYQHLLHFVVSEDPLDDEIYNFDQIYIFQSWYRTAKYFKFTSRRKQVTPQRNAKKKQASHRT